jgi:hypothetical protein
MDSLFSFPVGLFHPLRTCRFIPTLSECAVIQELSARSPQNSRFDGTRNQGTAEVYTDRSLGPRNM